MLTIWLPGLDAGKWKEAENFFAGIEITESYPPITCRNTQPYKLVITGEQDAWTSFI